MTNLGIKQRALISVSDKEGIIDFANQLVNSGVEIVSTGGTKKALQEADIPVISVEDVTGFPEILDGRVKTLHPNVHAGLLAKRNEGSIYNKSKNKESRQSIYWSSICIHLKRRLLEMRGHLKSP